MQSVPMVGAKAGFPSSPTSWQRTGLSTTRKPKSKHDGYAFFGAPPTAQKAIELGWISLPCWL
jgi:hypothetical protein